MRFRLALTVVSMLGLAGTSATANAQSLIDRHEKARRIANGGEGGRDFPEVDAAHRRLDISRATHVVVMDLDPEEVVGEIAGTAPADPDFPAVGAEG
jgi:hypothetical protein